MQAARYPNSTIAKQISEIRKVHDRFHLQNHLDVCKMGELNPDRYAELKNVNTEVAEQFFSHLLRFVHTFRNTSAIRAPIWILLIVHQWNLKKEVKLNNSLPTKTQIKNDPSLGHIKSFRTWEIPSSKRSKHRLTNMKNEFKDKLLKPWCKT